jgi:FAD-dependent oxidoreductase domain-containing protein 1
MLVSPQVIIIGAGILGLASAYHILQGHPGLDMIVIERLPTPGRGNTARSAAAYRDMFSSPVNRRLSQGSIAFYERLQNQSIPIDLKNIGYLWLMTATQMADCRLNLANMAMAGVKFKILDRPELLARLPNFAAGDITQGILGLNCGILNPNLLTSFYEQEARRLGARFAYSLEVTGFTRDRQGQINGIVADRQQIKAPTSIVATGAWMGLTMALVGLEAPVTPRKRQLFSVSAREGPLSRLFHARGFNDHDLLPFTILPGGAYVRPAITSFLLGYANPDQPPDIANKPSADPDFYESRIRPQLVPYFPAFQGLRPEYAWAGHYADHVPDSTPFVERLGGVIVVGGTSGSGIMKADSLGRIVAGLYAGQDKVELDDGQFLKVSDLGLKNRSVPPEEFVI